MEKYKFKLGMHSHDSDRLTFLNIEKELMKLWEVYIVLGSCTQGEVKCYFKTIFSHQKCKIKYRKFYLRLVMHYSQWHHKEHLHFTSGLKPDFFALLLWYTHAEMIIIVKKVDPKPTDIHCLCSRYKSLYPCWIRKLLCITVPCEGSWRHSVY